MSITYVLMDINRTCVDGVQIEQVVPSFFIVGLALFLLGHACSIRALTSPAETITLHTRLASTYTSTICAQDDATHNTMLHPFIHFMLPASRLIPIRRWMSSRTRQHARRAPRPAIWLPWQRRRPHTRPPSHNFTTCRFTPSKHPSLLPSPPPPSGANGTIMRRD